jgi:hypothetical protein
MRRASLHHRARHWGDAGGDEEQEVSEGIAYPRPPKTGTRSGMVPEPVRPPRRRCSMWARCQMSSGTKLNVGSELASFQVSQHVWLIGRTRYAKSEPSPSRYISSSQQVDPVRVGGGSAAARSRSRGSNRRNNGCEVEVLLACGIAHSRKPLRERGRCRSS